MAKKGGLSTATGTAKAAAGARLGAPTSDGHSVVLELQRRRAYECRIDAGRELESLEGAAAFLSERGLLTRTPDSSLPSLFEACHEEPYLVGGRGFAAWPRTKWSWAGELEQRPGVTVLKVHRGKNLLLSPGVLTLVDPICRAELVRMASGAAASSSKADRDLVRLLDHLGAVGPSMLGSLQSKLDLTPRELKALRYPLERCGVLVARQTLTGAADGEGHLHTTQLARYDQVVPEPLADLDPARALEELLVAGVRAAVLAEEGELRRWFSWSWYLTGGTIERLLAAGRLVRPAPGLVALGPAA
jgi:hypothetical protein